MIGKCNTDIDECKNPSLYSCPSGFDCANTLSSYECVCNGRITNGKCEDEGYTRYRLNLRLKEEYTNALSNNASQEFKAIETRITNAMAKVYENNDAYDGIEVKKMKNGSVVAEMELIFTDKNTKGISELLETVRNNSFGDFDVDPNALTVVITGTCESQQCPGHSTCKQLTPDTISCPCNDGYYYDGVSCKEFIVIKVEVTLEKEFTEELNNKSSQVYQELERNITAELYETFKDTPNFQEVVVLGFRNGSVIVDFKVVYRKDKNNKKIVVAETVREQIVKTGKLGNYQVKSAVVQGSPPPPAGLKETGKTDNSIDISWEKPKGHSAFVINGYMVRHKTDAETQYKNQYISATSGVLNAVLTGLESDTIYEITVHAYNNDGNGTKLKIQVTTEKPDDSTMVVIIVVVIVIVLLLIVAMVVFFQLRKRRYRYETRRAAYANRSKEGPVTMGLATMPSKSTNYDNYGQTDEEASTSQKL